MNFSIDQHREDGVEIISPRGHLVTETTDLFSARVDITLPRTQRVIIDLTHTSLLDEDGMAALLRAEHMARQQNCMLRVAGVHGAAEKVFTSANGWARFGGNSTLEEELERFKAKQAAEAYFDLGRPQQDEDATRTPNA